jgi:hypothetical protein
VQGLLRFLVSPHAEAAALRERYVFKVTATLPYPYP